MKRYVILLLTAFSLQLLLIDSANAQVIIDPCSSPAVDATCVGTCGGDGLLEYSGPTPSLSQAIVRELFCVKTESSSLCPTHNTKTSIFVNGKILDVYNSTSAGTTYSFSAIKGSNIRVVTELVSAKTDINCVWLGEVNLTLRKKP